MDKGKQVRIIAVIMMAIALTFGYWTAVHAEETEEEQTVETTTQETQEDDGQTIDETKQKLEEISTKVDKVDNQIASQKVDSEKIAEQAKDIEALKVDLEEVKSTLQTVNVPTTSSNRFGNPYEGDKLLPLRTTKRYYIYKLTTYISQGFKDFIIISNSEKLNLVLSNTAASSNYSAGISGIYTEDDLKQPIVGIQINREGQSSFMTEEEAIEILKNPNNWGWYPKDKTLENVNRKALMGYFKRDSNERVNRYMIVPANGEPNAENNYNEEIGYYTAIAYKNTADLTSDSQTPYLIQVTSNDFNNYWKLELLETVEPPLQEWTTEQLYMPVLVIMSILVIILFKKH